MKNSRVLVFSIALIGYGRIFRHCIDTHRSYCQQHGYDYVLIDRFPGSPEKEEATWLKIALMVEALKSNYDWVFYVDADCEIREHTPRIELLEVPDKYVYLAPGHSGYINAGILIAQSSIEAVHFFESVINGSSQPVPELSIVDWGDNPYVIHYAKNNPHIYLLEHDWNNNTTLDPQSYIIHYSSGTFRELYLSRYSRQIDQLRGKIIRKINNIYLKYSSKQGILKDRLNRYMDFYRSHYCEFRSQDLKVTAKTY